MVLFEASLGDEKSQILNLFIHSTNTHSASPRFLPLCRMLRNVRMRALGLLAQNSEPRGPGFQPFPHGEGSAGTASPGLPTISPGELPGDQGSSFTHTHTNLCFERKRRKRFVL